LGRWTAADPIGIGDGLNKYRYARNNPLSWTDSTGKDAEQPESNSRYSKYEHIPAVGEEPPQTTHLEFEDYEVVITQEEHEQYEKRLHQSRQYPESLRSSGSQKETAEFVERKVTAGMDAGAKMTGEYWIENFTGPIGAVYTGFKARAEADFQIEMLKHSREAGLIEMTDEEFYAAVTKINFEVYVNNVNPGLAGGGAGPKGSSGGSGNDTVSRTQNKTSSRKPKGGVIGRRRKGKADEYFDPRSAERKRKDSKKEDMLHDPAEDWDSSANANSYRSTKGQYLYVIEDRNGNVLKYGTASSPNTRYRQALWRIFRPGARMVILMGDPKKGGVNVRTVRKAERDLIRRYKDLNGGKRPPFNIADH
jgi:hypothetical protein